MSNNYLIEKLGAIKNEMSHIWGGIFITGGGAFTILSTNLNEIKAIIATLGILMMLIFINAYMIRRTELFNILSKLKKEEN